MACWFMKIFAADAAMASATMARIDKLGVKNGFGLHSGGGMIQDVAGGICVAYIGANVSMMIALAGEKCRCSYGVYSLRIKRPAGITALALPFLAAILKKSTAQSNGVAFHILASSS